MRRYLDVLLLFGSLIFGLLSTEAVYRVWLFAKLRVLAGPVRYDPAPSFGVFNPPPWRFDPDGGFSYVPGLSFWTANVNKGEFVGCSQPQVMANEQGNIGRVIGSYDAADIKILVFGDSFATMHFNGDTWPNLLQRKLETATGKRVHVVNFGRDSFGLLQMLDLAAREVPRWKPDYVIIAFITNDLIRPRYWRVVREVRGHWRMIMAMEPNEHIDPGPDTSTNEVALVSPAVTREWCQAMAARTAAGDRTAARTDPTVIDLIKQYNSIRAENPRQIIDPGHYDPWTLRTSYFYNRIALGDTFRGTGVRARRVGYASIDLTSFVDDSKFVGAVRRVLDTGAKPILVHFPVRPEVERRKQYLWHESGSTDETQGPSLVKSLEHLLGTQTINLLEFMPPVKDFTPYISSPTDWHPNAEGVEIYSDALAKALVTGDRLSPPKR